MILFSLIILIFLFNGCYDYCEQEEQLPYSPSVESNEWATITPEVIGLNNQKLNETLILLKIKDQEHL